MLVFSKKLLRLASRVGCFIGAAIMLLSAVAYLSFVFLPRDSDRENTMALVLCGCLVAFILCQAWSRDRFRSWNNDEFFGGGLWPETGRLWRSLRAVLWIL